MRVIRAALLDCCAHLLRGLSEEGPKQAAAPSQGRAGLVMGVLRPWSGWPAGGRWFGRGILELRQSKTGEQGRTGEQTGEQIAIFWRFSLEKTNPATPTIYIKDLASQGAKSFFS